MTNAEASEKISAIRTAEWFKVIRTESDPALSMVNVIAEFPVIGRIILTFREAAAVKAEPVAA